MRRSRASVLYVWTTWRCNLHCAYCDQAKLGDTDMTEETASAVSKWANENSVQNIQFFGGEPLYNQKAFKQILAQTHCNKYGVTTNGTIMDEGLYEWMRLHRVRVALSLDGLKEVHDKYRDGSYDNIMENIDRWLSLTSHVLSTVADVEHAYDCVAHIRDLGFRGVFLNLLHPYNLGYDDKQISLMETEYTRIIKELHNPPDFSVNDYVKTMSILRNKQRSEYTPGCGITRRGLAVDPEGYMYPCHRAMEMGTDFAIGSVWNGVDPVRERRIRMQVSVIPEKCKECPLKCLPCPVACYRTHGEFGVDPEDWYCEALKTRIKVVQKLSKPIHATAHPHKPVH